MTPLKYYIFISSFVINNGEWFSATLIESDKSFLPMESKEFSTNQILNNTQNFVPIINNLRMVDEEYSQDDNIKSRWHFINRRPINISESQYHNKVFSPNRRSSTKGRPKFKECREICSMMKKSNRSKTRFLEVFQVVQFDNVACTSSSGLEGTCLHEYECQSSGGTGMGTCADGYGTCCVTLLPCDSKSSASIGWFTNPAYPLPSSDRISCAVALNKYSEDVTQIRLDFDTFELLPPTDGVCQEDQFIVSGQNVNNAIPILCGINTGQHVYIEVGETEGPVYLSIQTANPESRLFSIKVTQLTSSDEKIAPPGCLQYYTEPKGYMESFNYRDKSDISITRASSYLNNLNYAMCIGRMPGTCSVTYTNVGYLQIVNYDTDGLPVIPPGQAGVEIFNCPSDWLLISATRLCGDRLNDGSVIQDFSLNAPITDNNAGPIVVWFRSDEGYVGRGFKIKYEQNSCTPTGN